MCCHSHCIELNGIQSENRVRAKDCTCTGMENADDNSHCPAYNPLERIEPLFNHGLVDENTIFSLVRDMNSYLKKISPILNDVQLDIDPTGILFRHALSA